MDKEIVVHIYNGILLSNEKEHIWDGSNEEDEPKAYCTEWSKSEREKKPLFYTVPKAIIWTKYPHHPQLWLADDQ